MRSPYIIISLVLFFFLSLILQTRQINIDQTHRIGSNVQDVNDVAVTSPEGRRREGFRVRRPMTTWRKGKMLSDRKHGVPSGPNPISNR
ncbi:hypothetical protein EUTSA_v10017483mg [Eutrema salsugineum]|uniref:Uncharacterized protein n=1 Tax=Eutrema salsugineum TaxID=72664 RepID=V4MAH4_EUTSA|nr:CLAVATA3/ESR (CLE)-related protein 42 [Eutrema salsugineum]ESQ52102.1 hypothetical protein EUTSA_v10017483mg [Eutrema salsugineum]